MNYIARCQLLLIALLCSFDLHADPPSMPPPVHASYIEHSPRSILVLPPLNESTQIEASYRCLSTVTQPLAELGYYVFPVAVIDQYLKANGMPTAGEMHQISLGKVVEIIGADAVLYLNVQHYDAQLVTIGARLVDTRSAALLWEGSARAEYHPSTLFESKSPHNAWDFLGELLLDMLVDDLTGNSQDLCSQVSVQLFSPGKRGMPYGPYHLKHVVNQVDAHLPTHIERAVLESLTARSGDAAVNGYLLTAP